MRIALLSLLVACAHAAPVVTPNHAIEYVTILDARARCVDWRLPSSPVHPAMCMSGDSLFWCVSIADAKPKCELLYAPKKAESAPTPEQPKPEPAPAPTLAPAPPPDVKATATKGAKK